MLSGRTKHGLPLRSTIGMRQGNHAEQWFLVADRSRLRLFEKIEDESNHTVELRQEFENPDGRKKSADILSDRPGRTFESQDVTTHGQTGGVRHSYGNAVDLDRNQNEKLAKQAVEMLAECAIHSGHNSLSVLAEPKLLGALKAALSQAMPKREIQYIEKDYAWLTPAELQSRLTEMVS